MAVQKLYTTVLQIKGALDPSLISQIKQLVGHLGTVLKPSRDAVGNHIITLKKK